MKQINILMIANSFGVNIQQYVNPISKAAGTEIHIGVLYIGGCSLETHANNIAGDIKAYDYYENGPEVAKGVSIKEALGYRKWDIITFQQVSGLSGKYESFYPFINQVKDYVVSMCPNAKLGMHETWQYNQDTWHPQFADYDKDPIKMHRDIKHAYRHVEKDLGIELVIHSNDVVWAIMGELDDRIHLADGFHMNSLGEYCIALGMVHDLLGLEKIDNLYVPEGMSQQMCEKIEKIIRPIYRK